MRAMILAAGRGERMRPLTNHTPKPLLKVGGKTLIEYHLLALRQANIQQVVINLSHLGNQIQTALGDGSAYGLEIHYSDEGSAALETAGGIKKALPLLGTKPFLVINGDIWCDAPLHDLQFPTGKSAHLLMVNNPKHNPKGDFYLHNGLLHNEQRGGEKLTFSGIGLYHPKLFQNLPAGVAPLAPLLREAMKIEQVSAEHYRGEWLDIGTPARLHELDQRLQQQR
ncbi:MAG: nucleotidyltransferase family protein [Gammaproteobacteria bacterium]|nr:nucleotidyltransferase family protein [Gammaproteobacteria bacterium]